MDTPPLPERLVPESTLKRLGDLADAADAILRNPPNDPRHDARLTLVHVRDVIRGVLADTPSWSAWETLYGIGAADLAAIADAAEDDEVLCVTVLRSFTRKLA